MDDGVIDPNWGKLVGKEFQAVYSDIESAEIKVFPEQHERERKETQQKATFWA